MADLFAFIIRRCKIYMDWIGEEMDRKNAFFLAL